MNNHSECTLSQRRKRPMDLVLSEASAALTGDF